MSNKIQSSKSLLKTINTIPCNGNQIVVDGFIKLREVHSLAELDSKVILTSNMYEKIFGEKKKNANTRKKRLSIVKISYNGKSIHRDYMSTAVSGMSDNDVGLTLKSIKLLNAENFNGELILSPGFWLAYYWQHPDNAVRLSIKMGVLSLFIALVSLFISLFFNCRSF